MKERKIIHHLLEKMYRKDFPHLLKKKHPTVFRGMIYYFIKQQKRSYKRPLFSLFHIVNWLRLLSWICFTLVPVVDFTSLPSTSDSLSGLVSLRPSANALEPVQKTSSFLLTSSAQATSASGHHSQKWYLIIFSAECKMLDLASFALRYTSTSEAASNIFCKNYYIFCDKFKKFVLNYT